MRVRPNPRPDLRAWRVFMSCADENHTWKRFVGPLARQKWIGSFLVWDPFLFVFLTVWIEKKRTWMGLCLQASIDIYKM